MASVAHHQLTVGPMEVSRVGTRKASANSVGNESAEKVGSVDLVTAMVQAGKRVGLYDKELAAVFNLSPADYSKAFSLDDDTRNKPMKAKLPKELAEAFVRVMAEMLGLRIGGTADQSRAFANLMQACADVIKAGQ
jgi:hypothetical protein